MLPFWERVRALLGTDLSMSWLCRHIGISTGTLSSWMFNNRIPRADNAAKIAKALGVTVEYLINGNEYDETAAQNAITHAVSKALKINAQQTHEMQCIPVYRYPEEIESADSKKVPLPETILKRFLIEEVGAIEILDNELGDENLQVHDIAFYQKGFISSEGVYVISKDGRFLVRRLSFNHFNRTITSQCPDQLQSDMDYPDPAFTIEGKVIGWYHNLEHGD